MDQFDLIEATATDVKHKELKRKADGRSFLLYTVETNKGSFTTAKRELAEQANALVGRPATWHVKTEQRGEFTNYYLESVEPVSNGASHSDSSSFPQPAEYGSKAEQAPIGNPSPSPVDRDILIFRQVAAKVSANISETSDEFWKNVVDLVGYFTTGNLPGVKKNEFIPESALQTPDTTAVAYVHSDDDIPF